MVDVMAYELLGAVSLVAGFLSAVAGSSGLIILPVLLIVGVPPQIALGTNKFYTSASLFTSAYCFIRNGLFTPRFWLAAIFATIVGAIIGVGLTQIFSNQTLKMLLPILIAAMAVYLLIPKKPLALLDPPIKPFSRKSLTMSSFLGIYSGFLGAGTGSLWTMVATSMFGMEIMEASALSRFMCFISNFVALIMFVILCQVDYSLAIVLSLSGALGAYFGSRLAIRWGAKFMRTILVSSTLVMAGNLAVSNGSNYS